jgi:hypothetical protein
MFYLFSYSMGINKDGVVVADADADADGNSAITSGEKEIETTTTTSTTTILCDDDDEITQICYGIGDGEEIIEGTVTLGETTTTEEEEEEPYDEKKKKKVEEEEGEDEEEGEEEDAKTKTISKNNNVIEVSYYHQAATNRRPNVKIHHIVLLHGQRFTKENWKTSGILSMFNKQFPSIAVTACNLSCDADHYTLIDLLDKLESKGIISLPLSGLVTPSASGKTITDWLCEQIVNDDDDDDDSTVVTEDDEENEDKEDDGGDKENEEEGEEKDDDDKEKYKEDTEKIPLPLNLNILPQYVRRWIPVASYSVMNCTKNQLRLLGALSVCGENNDSNDNDNDDENNSNNNNNNNNNSKAFNILAIYGNYDEGGSIVSKRLEKYTYAKVEKLNGRHPVYLDSPDEFVPAIGWAII